MRVYHTSKINSFSLTLRALCQKVTVPREKRSRERSCFVKERGIFHAIVGVHPAHTMDANSIIEEFAGKYLKDLQA